MTAARGPRGAIASPAVWTGAAVAVVSMASHFRVPLRPDIGAELALAPAILGAVTTVFGVGRLLADVPAGALVDRIGARPMFVLSGAFVAVGGATFAAAPTTAWVLVAAWLMGIGSAVANTTGMAFFSSRASGSRRGRALAYYSAALLGGQALGPTISGWFAVLGSWRVAMLMTVVIGVAVALAALVARGRRASEPTSPPRTSPIPEGADEVVAVLRSSAIVLDENTNVVKASPSAYAFGLVRQDRITVPELLALAEKVHRDGQIREIQLQVPRTRDSTQTLHVLARVAPLGDRLVLALVEDRTHPLGATGAGSAVRIGRPTATLFPLKH
jgi:MFS family permease